MKLMIQRKTWSRGQINDSFKIEKYEIIQNQKYIIEENDFDEKFSFNITDFDDNGIKIHTFQPFSDQDGGINLMSDKRDFILNKGEELQLKEPRTSSGRIFILTLVD